MKITWMHQEFIYKKQKKDKTKSQDKYNYHTQLASAHRKIRNKMPDDEPTEDEVRVSIKAKEADNSGTKHVLQESGSISTIADRIKSTGITNLKASNLDEAAKLADKIFNKLNKDNKSGIDKKESIKYHIAELNNL